MEDENRLDRANRMCKTIMEADPKKFEIKKEPEEVMARIPMRKKKEQKKYGRF